MCQRPGPPQKNKNTKKQKQTTPHFPELVCQFQKLGGGGGGGGF